MRKALLAVALTLCFAPAAHAAGRTRLLYSSDWNGPTQIFAADPSGGETVGQVTFARAAQCGSPAIACGFVDPLPSPDGKRLAYLETGDPSGSSVLWIADADGRNARRIGEAGGSLAPGSPKRDRYAVWSPNSKELAYSTREGLRFVRAAARGTANGRWWRGWPADDVVLSPDRRWLAAVKDRQIVVTNRRTGQTRVLLAKQTFSLAWSPDSRALAYVAGRVGFDEAASGEVGIVTLSGRNRAVVQGRGQVESVAWTRSPSSVRYRRPDAVNGVFAGGPIGHLAADGGRVAYASCLDVLSWTPRSGTAVEVAARPVWLGGTCLAPNQRDEIYDLAVAGDRVAWGLKTSGLIFHWWLFQARVAQSVEQFELANGSNALGSNWYGAGGLAGSGGALVYSAWETSPDPASGFPVTAMTLFRATDGGCPCPAIGYGAARENFTRGAGLTPIMALDTDGSRIAALRYDNLVVYDSSGRELTTVAVRPAAAQFAGDDLVVLVPGELRVYAANGMLRHSWPVPSSSVGRDCRYYSEPQCQVDVELTLQDAASGLAAYAFRGGVHVLRLADGRDTVAGYGSEARFMNDGLVYADGARVRLVPFGQLFR